LKLGRMKGQIFEVGGFGWMRGTVIE